MVKKKLPIEYNSNAPLGVVSDDPLAFLLHTQLFDDFQIVTDSKQRCLSYLNFESQTINLQVARGPITNLTRLFTSKKFIELVKANPKRKYVLYSPLDPPYKVNPLTYLMNSPTIAH